MALGERIPRKEDASEHWPLGTDGGRTVRVVARWNVQVLKAPGKRPSWSFGGHRASFPQEVEAEAWGAASADFESSFYRVGNPEAMRWG